MKRIEAGQRSQQWFTVKEASDILGKSAYTIRQYIKEGRLKAERVTRGAGGKGEWRIALEAIEQFQNPAGGLPDDPEAGSPAKLAPKQPAGSGHAVMQG